MCREKTSYDVHLTLLKSGEKYLQIKINRVETMAQWVRLLLYKNEDLSLNPQHRHKKPDMAMHACNPRTVV